MRPDKRKRNRGRNVEKSEGSVVQERKNDEKNDSKSEDKQTKSEETEKTEKGNATSNEGSAANEQSENQPAPALRRETDALKETKKFSKRQIFSNWEKYDEPIVHEEEEEEAHNDFGSLIQRNFSGDEHFKFKSERQWESESCNINQDLFTLDLEQLSAGLECIPYYKRLNLPTSFFSENELKRMQNYAKKQEKRYENLLNGKADSKTLIASLLGKLKENTDDQVIEKTNANSETQKEEVPFMDMGEFTMKDNNINLGEGLLCENIFDGNQLNEKLLNENQFSDKNDHEIKLSESKENENQVNESKVNKNEGDVVKVNSNEVQESEADKNEYQGKKCANDKEKARVSNALNNSNRQNGSQDLPTNTKVITNDIQIEKTIESRDTKIIEKDKQKEKSTEINVSVKSSSEEAVVKKDKPVRVPEVAVPLKTKDFKSKKISKIKGLGEEEEVLDSLLSLKEPAVPPIGLSKKKVEEEENEADGLLTDVSSIVIHEKKENLEEWLDSMLDD